MISSAPTRGADRFVAMGVALAARLPRPNPDPELPPAPDGAAVLWPWLGLAALVGLGAVIGAWIWRKRRSPTVTTLPPIGPEGTDPGVVRAAHEARRLLVLRFGDGWSALTTEQIAQHPDLATGLSPELAAELLSLLRQADQLKYGATPGPPFDPIDATARDQWATVLAGLGKVAAGASSTTTGR